jgi:RNA polymerase sigma-70 factor (ECF subfamily)
MPEHGAHEASLAHARTVWPHIHVPEGELRTYVQARLGAEVPSPEAAASLYLACACVRGDPAAIRAFDERYAGELSRAVAKLRLPPQEVADVVQSLRQHLLVSSGGAPGHLAEYAGRGDLSGWLRVTATRAGLKRLRGRKPELDADDALLAARAPGDDPELAYMKELYRHAFREAFGAALATLDAREKVMLRQHFVDGLGIDELGPLYGVHRATAARWVAQAKTTLMERTRREFMHRARLNPREMASVMRMVQSRLDVTLARLLV